MFGDFFDFLICLGSLLCNEAEENQENNNYDEDEDEEADEE